MSKCGVCGTESPAKYEWTGFRQSPREQHGWRIVCWHATGDDADVVVNHEAEACRDALRSEVDRLLALSNHRSAHNGPSIQ